MTVELKPETELLVLEEIQRGHFHSLDELIIESISAWREKHQAEPIPHKKKNLAQLFAESPFRGLSIDFERFPDLLGPGDL